MKRVIQMKSLSIIFNEVCEYCYAAMTFELLIIREFDNLLDA